MLWANQKILAYILKNILSKPEPSKFMIGTSNSCKSCCFLDTIIINTENPGHGQTFHIEVILAFKSECDNFSHCIKMVNSFKL